MVHTAAVVQRPFVQNLLMYTPHPYLKDTQCGFKLFSSEVAVCY